MFDAFTKFLKADFSKGFLDPCARINRKNFILSDQYLFWSLDISSNSNTWAKQCWCKGKHLSFRCSTQHTMFNKVEHNTITRKWNGLPQCYSLSVQSIQMIVRKRDIWWVKVVILYFGFQPSAARMPWCLTLK